MKRALALAFEDSDSDNEDVLFVRRPRLIRVREELFDTLDDKDFVTRFRLTKSTVLSVLEYIEDKIKFPSNINNSVSPINQLLCALRFYATGCYQMTAGDLCGFSTSTAHRIVHRVSAAIASLRPRHIYFPESQNEIRQTQTEFYKQARFPFVIGAIDCTHVKFIKSPGGECPEIFRNRKKYFSLNIQAISNAKLEFTDIVARWPGSTHDSYIFNNCYRRAMFERGNYGNAVLVGDAGYACNNYMMTPLDYCNTVAENLYNESQIRTRNCVERLFGIWKKRFPAMAIGLGVSVQNSIPIIVATAVLHNIARRSGEAMPPNDNHIINSASWDNIITMGNINNGNVDAHRTNPNYIRRNEFVTKYFARLSSTIPNMSKTALVILAEGAEEIETVATVDVLRRAGVKVTLAGLEGGSPILCSRQVTLVPDKSLADALAESPQYDAVILPGGLEGTERLCKSTAVGTVLKEHEKAGKIVAAICAAPTAFASHGIASGKRVTSYPSFKDKITAAPGGYKYVEGERVVVDGNIVTSRGPGTALHFGVKLAELLVGKEKANQVEKGMILVGY